MDLGQVLDQIDHYNKITKAHNFQLTGTGIKPWSHRYENGSEALDIRGSDWTFYDKNQEIATGRTPVELNDYLIDYKIYQSFQLI